MLTLTLKFFGSLKTVRMFSAWACISTSWISPGSKASSPFVFSFSLIWFSANAALSAACEAWRAGAGKLETEVIALKGTRYDGGQDSSIATDVDD